MAHRFEIKVWSPTKPNPGRIAPQSSHIQVIKNPDHTWTLWSDDHITHFQMGVGEPITCIKVISEELTSLHSSFQQLPELTTFIAGSSIFAGVTDFVLAWADNPKLTYFDRINVSLGTKFDNTWENTSSLGALPFLYAHQGKSFLAAFRHSGVRYIDALSTTGVSDLSKTSLMFSDTNIISPDDSEQYKLLHGSKFRASTNHWQPINEPPGPHQPKFWMKFHSPTRPSIYKTVGGTINITSSSVAGIWNLTSDDDITHFQVNSDTGTNNTITKIEVLNESLTSLKLTFHNLTALTDFVAKPTSFGRVTDMEWAWSECQSLVYISKMNTSNVQNFIQTWYHCANLTSFPAINTSSGTTFELAWEGCSSLTKFPWINTSNCTSLRGTWDSCYKLTSFPAIDTSKVTNLYHTWNRCHSLTKFPRIDTSKVTDFNAAWSECNSLTTFPEIDTISGSDFQDAWSDCTSLTCLAKIDTRQATKTTDMFARSTAIINPSKTEQAQLQLIPGMNWANHNVCGDYIPVTNLDMIITSLYAPSLDNPAIKVTDNHDGTWRIHSYSQIDHFIFTSNDMTKVEVITENLKSLQGTFTLQINLEELIADDKFGGVTNFEEAWESCDKLTSFPRIDTSSAVTLHKAWQSCTNLRHFPLIDTVNVKNFEAAWFDCGHIVTFPALDTSSGTNFLSTWQGCYNLRFFPKIDISKALNLQATWYGCSMLMVFPKLDTSSATNMSYTWGNCERLTCVGGVDTTSATNTVGLFNYAPVVRPNAAEQKQLQTPPGINWTNDAPCSYKFIMKVTSPIPVTTDNQNILSVDNSDGTYTLYSPSQINQFKITSTDITKVEMIKESLLSLDETFKDQRQLKEFVASRNTFLSVTNMNRAWENCTSLTSFPVIDLSKVTDLTGAWFGCSSLKSFPMMDTSTVQNFHATWGGCSSLTTFPQIETQLGTNFDDAWVNCSSLTSFPEIEVSKGTSFHSTWAGCKTLTTFPLLDTRSATAFYMTFTGCTGLTSFPNIETGKVIDFHRTWEGCTSLTSFPDIDTSSAENMAHTWDDCSSLTTFPIIDVSNVKSFESTWYNCKSLVNFPKLNTSKGLNFHKVFGRCSSLRCLKGINTLAGTNNTEMFWGASNLERPNTAEIAKLEAGDDYTLSGVCGPDFQKPVIQMIGTDVTIEKGVTYTDQGATATDNKDGDISSKIHVTSTVQGAIGDYTVTYNVQDAAGNKADPVVRNVHVVAKADTFKMKVWAPTKPTFTSDGTVQVTQENGYYLVTSSDITTIAFTSKDATKIEMIKEDLRSLLHFCKGLKRLVTFIAPSGMFSKVTNFASAWVYCNALTSFPKIDTSSGTDFRWTWADCNALTSFPKIDTSKGTDFDHAWHNCSSLTSFPLLDTSMGTNFNMAWNNCPKLTSFPKIDTSSGTNFMNAWDACSSLTSFPLIDTSKGNNFRGAWYGCSSLKCLSGVNTTKATDTRNMFGNTALVRPTAAEQAEITKTPGINWINDTTCPYTVPHKNFEIIVTSNTPAKPPEVTKVQGGTINVTDNQDGTWTLSSDDHITHFLFTNACKPGITKINVIEEELTSLNNTFKYLSNMTDFIAPSTAFGEVTNFFSAWESCSNLTSSPMIDTSKGTTFGFAWHGCSSLTTFPLLDTSKGTDFNYAWEGCSSLTSFPLIDTSKGTDFHMAWDACSKLKCLSGVNTTKATSTYSMFDKTPVLVRPTKAEQAEIMKTPGINWVNDEVCGAATKPKNTLEIIVTGPFTLSNPDITIKDNPDGTKTLTSFKQVDHLVFDTSTITKIEIISEKFISLKDTFSIPTLTELVCPPTAFKGVHDFQNAFKDSSILDFPVIDTSNGQAFVGTFENTKMLSLPKLDTSKGLTFTNMFKDAELLCLSELDTTSQVHTDDMFLNTKLINPNTGNQAKLLTGFHYVNTHTCPVDVIDPVITIIGTDEKVIEGQTYVDKGATATDNHDGDITANIVVTNLPDTSKLGRYNVTYTVIDQGGNTATAVRVVDVHSKSPYKFDVKITALLAPAYHGSNSVNMTLTDNHDGTWELTSNDPQPDFGLGGKHGGSDTNITKVEILKEELTNLDQAFIHMEELEEFIAYPYQLGKVTSFTETWKNCSKLLAFPLIDTSSAGTLDQTWINCTELTTFPAIDTSSCIHFGHTWAHLSKLLAFPMIDTSSAKTVWGAWSSCSSLTTFPKIDLTTTDDMADAWGDCSGLTSIPDLDYSNIVHARDTFINCTGLINVDINLPKCNNIEGIFNGCHSLKAVKIQAAPLTTKSAFANCDKLVSVSGLDTSSCKVFTEMFLNCLNLLCLDNLDTHLMDLPEDLSIFNGAHNLLHPNRAEQQQLERKSVYVNTHPCPFDKDLYPTILLNGAATVKLHSSDSYVELGATAIDHVDGDITSKIIKSGSVGSADGLYTISYSVTNSHGNTSSVYREVERTTGQGFEVIITSTVEPTSVLTDKDNNHVTVTAIDNQDGTWTVKTDKVITHLYNIQWKDATKIEFIHEDLESLNAAFQNYNNLVEFKAKTNSFRKSTSFHEMFNGCSVLTSVSLFDTSLATDFTDTFSGCSALKSIPTYNFLNAELLVDTFKDSGLEVMPSIAIPKVTNMIGTWHGCSSLIKMGRIDTASVEMMTNLYNGCVLLECIPILNTVRAATSGTHPGNMFTDMFKDTPALLQPDASTRAELTSSRGLNFKGSCNKVGAKNAYLGTIPVTMYLGTIPVTPRLG